MPKPLPLDCMSGSCNIRTETLRENSNNVKPCERIPADMQSLQIMLRKT